MKDGEFKMRIYKYFLTILLFITSIGAYAQVAVIANKSVSENSIDESKLTELYTLKTKTWDNGSAVILLTLKGDNNTSDKFFDKIGKSSMKMKKIWMKKQLTGEGQAPEGFGSEDEMLNKVASTPGAIGFVDATKVNDNLLVLV
jgi:ABC-type phosphate transport system substrate-binding protein